jgi:Protein of unknown function (DUF1456)
MLNNNDILKKLRVALSLQHEDIIKILALSNFEMSKGALGDLFRNEEHPSYMEAGDQVLRHFLNGLIIYKRGVLPIPKSNLKNEEGAEDIQAAPRHFNKKEAPNPKTNQDKRSTRFIDNKGGLKKKRY